jgi:hypothetical protein
VTYRSIAGQQLEKHVPDETDSWGARVESGSNTITVTLGVVGGEEKGSLKSETVKIWSRVPRDSDARKTALARASSIRYTKYRPVLSLERAPHKKQDRNLSNSNK